MGYDQKTGKRYNRYKMATEALKSVLSNLPPQTVVGLLRSNGNPGKDDGSDPLVELVEKGVHDFNRGRSWVKVIGPTRKAP